MHCTCISAALLSVISLVFLTSPVARASPPEAHHEPVNEEGDFGQFEEDPDLIKRLSNFVRIGRPSSKFVRFGRPSNFVRIGRSSLEDENNDVYPDTDDDIDMDKRASRFVRIGKASRYLPMSRFVRIGRGGDNEDKRMSSFVRIGKADPTLYSADEDVEDADKRAASSFVRIGRMPSSAFVRIGKIPASAFVRIGRRPGQLMSGEEGDYGTFDRAARMGQSSFVRIGKREVDEQAAADQQKASDSAAAPNGQ